MESTGSNIERFSDQADAVSPFKFMLSAEEMLDAMEQMASNFGIDLPEVIRCLTTMYAPAGREITGQFRVAR